MIPHTKYPTSCETCGVVLTNKFANHNHKRRSNCCEEIMKKRVVEPSVATPKKARFEEEGEGKLIDYSNIIKGSSSAVETFYTTIFQTLKATLHSKGNDPSSFDDIIKNGKGIEDKIHEMRMVAKQALEKFEPIKLSIKEEMQGLYSLKNDDLKEFIKNSRQKVVDSSDKINSSGVLPTSKLLMKFRIVKRLSKQVNLF